MSMTFQDNSAEDKYINPFTDYGFKLLFGREEAKSNMLYLINSLELVPDKVVDLTYMDKEVTPQRESERVSIYDIFCKTETGDNFIVEMQNRQQDNFVARSIYYVSNAIVSQGRKGNDWQYGLVPVYFVAFMNFELPEFKGEFRTDAALLTLPKLKPLTRLCHFTFLQLPLYSRNPQECKTNLQKLTYIMNNMETLSNTPWREDPDIERLAVLARRASLSEADNYYYEASLKRYRDDLNAKATAMRLGREEGRAIGIEEGRAEGREEGRAEGHAEGHAEGLAEGISKMVKMMFSSGMSVEKIMQVTQMSREEVEAALKD